MKKYVWACVPLLAACVTGEASITEFGSDAGVDEASLALIARATEPENMLRIHTCDHDRAATKHPVTASVQFLNAELLPQGRTFALDEAGWTKNAWQEFDLGSSGLPTDMQRLKSLVIAKDGKGNAWCIDQVELVQGGLLRWRFDARNARPNDTLVRRPSGVLWLDDAGEDYAPTNSIRFADLEIEKGDAAPQAPIELEIDTCDEEFGGSADPVTVTYTHDGLSEIVPLADGGRSKNATTGYVLDEHGIRIGQSIKLTKTGSDMWCFDALRLKVGSKLVKQRLARTTLESTGGAVSFTWNLGSVVVGGGSSTVSRVGLALQRSAQWTGAATDAVAKFMSFNTRWGACLSRRYMGQAKMIGSEGPDVAGLQELRREKVSIYGAPEASFIGTYRDELAKWGRYALVADEIIHDGKEMNDLVPIFFREDRFQKISSGVHSGTSSADRNKNECPGEVYGVRWVRLKHRATGREFVAFNTHLDIGPCVVYSQAKDLKEFIASKPYLTSLERLFERSLPVVLLGDFNLDPASENADGSLKNVDTLGLFSWHGLSSVVPWTEDTFRRQGGNESPTYVWGVPGRVLDHIFVDTARLETLSTGVHSTGDVERASAARFGSNPRDECDVKSADGDGSIDIDQISASVVELLNFQYSDHLPIMATVKIK